MLKDVLGEMEIKVLNSRNKYRLTYNEKNIGKFKEYLYQNRWSILIAFVFSIICCLAMICFEMINIDEETWYLSTKKEMSNLWLYQERYMIYIYNMIFSPCGRFIPIVSDCLGLLFWNMSGVVFMYVFFDLYDISSKYGRIVALCWYNSVPLCMGEAFGFGFMIIPETFAMIIVALAFLLIIKEKHGWLDLIFAGILMTVSMGVYQALLEIFIVAVVSWCFGCYLKENKWFKTAIRGAIVCVISMILYCCINFIIKKYFGSASYLSDGYIGWGSGSVIRVLFMACANVIRVSLGLTMMGKYVYGAWALRILFVIFVVAVGKAMMKTGDIKKRVIIVLGAAVLLGSPFFLYIAMGTYETYGRMLLSLALSGAVELLFVFKYVDGVKFRKIIYCFVGIILFLNCIYMNLLYYRGYKVYDDDVVTAKSIMKVIEEKKYDYINKPIVFVGKYGKSLEENGGSGTLAASFWNWDDCNMSRTRDPLGILGYRVILPTASQIDEALGIIGNMSVWPAENAIRETNDIIIVYLSSPSPKWIELNKSLVG